MRYSKKGTGARRRTAGANRLTAVIAAVTALLLLLSGCSRLPSDTTEEAQQAQEAQNEQTVQEEPLDTDLPEEPAAQEETPEESVQEPAADPVQEEDAVQEDGGDDWKLILVNADHPLPEDYSVKLKELRNDQWVDERIYPELQQMFDDARAEGIYPLINESYRTAERQQEILDSYIASYEAEGLSREEAEEQALSLVAVPGTSEHQLGLALDIIVEYEEDSTQTWQWLKDNCWRYGFILRYPEDKSEITGIDYEPWHFRYVGAEAAKQIMEQGITLEEYLEEKDDG